MKNKSLNRLVMGLALVATVAIASVALAQEQPAPRGGNSSGGGRTVGEMLYDIYEKTRSTPIQIEKTAGFHTEVNRVMADIRGAVPGFADEMQESLTKRNWVFVEDEFTCPDQPALKVGAELIACQGRIKIRIHRARFSSKPVTTQGHVIIHEMVRYVYMKHGMKDEDSIYDLVPLLLESPKEEDLRVTLEKLEYGRYPTASEIKRAEARMTASQTWQVQTLSQIHRTYCQGLLPAEEKETRSHVKGWVNALDAARSEANARFLPKIEFDALDRPYHKSLIKFMEEIGMQINSVIAGNIQAYSTAVDFTEPCLDMRILLDKWSLKDGSAASNALFSVRAAKVREQISKIHNHAALRNTDGLVAAQKALRALEKSWSADEDNAQTVALRRLCHILIIDADFANGNGSYDISNAISELSRIESMAR